MTKFKLSYTMGGLAALLFLSVALAAGGVVPRDLMGSGGGAVRSDGLSLRASIGQPVAGTVSNGLTLCSGFLCGSGAPIGSAQEHTVYLPFIVR